jgi:hypothetical protein
LGVGIGVEPAGILVEGKRGDEKFKQTIHLFISPAPEGIHALIQLSTSW